MTFAARHSFTISVAAASGLLLAILVVAPGRATSLFASFFWVILLIECAVMALTAVAFVRVSSVAAGAAIVNALVDGAAVVYVLVAGLKPVALDLPLLTIAGVLLVGSYAVLKLGPRQAPGATLAPGSAEAQAASAVWTYALLTAGGAFLLAVIHPAFGVALVACAAAYAAICLRASRRTIEYELTDFVAASPERVFDVVANFRNAIWYHHGIELYEPIDPGPPHKGTRIQARIRRPDHVFEGIDEVVEYRRPELLALRTIGPMANLWTLSLRPVDGGSELNVRYWSRATPASALVSGGSERAAVREKLIAMRREWVEALKRAVEPSTQADALR